MPADASQLEETYDEWLAEAQKAFFTVRLQGLEARWVNVEVHELVAWCKARKLRVNGKSRASYVIEKLQIEETQGAG